MKEIIYNYDFLKESEVTETVIRTKAVLVTESGIVIGNENSIFQFPGGHLEENESFEDCLKREILEETGIEITDEKIDKPFMKVTYLSKDWPEEGKNRKAEIYYYAIETLKKPDISKVNYTEHEKEENFKIEVFPLKEAISIIKNNIPNNKMNKIIAPDMILAIEEYLNVCEE